MKGRHRLGDLATQSRKAEFDRARLNALSRRAEQQRGSDLAVQIAPKASTDGRARARYGAVRVRRHVDVGNVGTAGCLTRARHGAPRCGDLGGPRRSAYHDDARAAGGGGKRSIACAQHAHDR